MATAERQVRPSKAAPRPAGTAGYRHPAPYLLLAAVALLVALGVVTVPSASSGEAVISQTSRQIAELVGSGASGEVASMSTAPFSSGIKHGISILVGVAILMVMTRFDYRRWMPLAAIGGVLVLAGLAFVLLRGESTLGASRWISVGGFSLQPSELAKPVALVFVTLWLHRLMRAASKGQPLTQNLWKVALVVAAVVVMVSQQPDKGTALIIATGLLAVYASLGLPTRSLWTLGAVVVPALAVFVVLSLSGVFGDGYPHNRINDYYLSVTGQAEPHYQVEQAEMAIGSGGLTGVGIGQSRQKYSWVPEAQNDFILAIIGEELGLVGTLTVVLAYGVILWAGIAIALNSRSRVGGALAIGAVTMLTTQAALNIGSVLQLTPVTGKPLPFVTLGGSAMIASFMLVGVILSVARFGGVAESAPAQETSRQRTAAPRRGSRRRVEEGSDEICLDWGRDRRSRVPRSSAS